jgi:hypothetical protein
MNESTREFVRQRAGDRCEYCHIHQRELPFASFHVEHVIARQHGGGDEAENLALACHQCNRHKGTNLSGIDPVAQDVVRLFDPRQLRWDEHFAIRDFAVIGLTATGRATVALLRMNSPDRVALRAELGY